MRLVCGKCNGQFKTKTVGVTLLETAGREQRPYGLWGADLLMCACGQKLIRTADYPAARDEKAGEQAEQIKAHGGEIFFDHEYPAEPAVASAGASERQGPDGEWVESWTP